MVKTKVTPTSDTALNGTKTQNNSVPKEPEAVQNEAERTETPEISKDEGSENPNKEDEAADGSFDHKEEVGEAVQNEESQREEAISVEPTESEVDIEAAGSGKFVEEALEFERVKERDTLKQLVEENVKLERELQKTKENFSSTLYAKDDLELQIECEKQENKNMKQQIQAKDKEVQDLEVKLRLAEAEIINARGEDEALESAPLLYDKVTLEKRLQDTQIKMKRMLNDGEEKDEQISRLQNELYNTQLLCYTLKDNIKDKEKLDSIIEEPEKKKVRLKSENEAGLKLEGLEEEEEVVRKQEPKSHHKDSKICVVQ